MDDAQQTVNFLYEHQCCIHSAAFGTFLLERYSPAHLYPGQYGITRIHEDATKDLDYTLTMKSIQAQPRKWLSYWRPVSWTPRSRSVSAISLCTTPFAFPISAA
jgi:hypothetical protein